MLFCVWEELLKRVQFEGVISFLCLENRLKSSYCYQKINQIKFKVVEYSTNTVSFHSTISRIFVSLLLLQVCFSSSWNEPQNIDATSFFIIKLLILNVYWFRFYPFIHDKFKQRSLFWPFIWKASWMLCDMQSIHSFCSFHLSHQAVELQSLRGDFSPPFNNLQQQASTLTAFRQTWPPHHLLSSPQSLTRPKGNELASVVPRQLAHFSPSLTR